jgi:dipeptidyl aminopeptidase/acylaminoacyl peptidase
VKRAVIILVGLVALLPRGASTAGSPSPTIEEFLRPGTPTEVVAAKKAERIAWTAYEHGLRNVYTAAGPAFAPVRLTNVTKDDGVELSDVSISDDGRVVVFVRGTQPNRDGWIANPTADPAGALRTIWVASTVGGAAWKLGEGTTPALSPDGSTVAYAKDGQIYAYAIGAGASDVEPRRTTPLVKAWGTNGTPVWSPDGSKFAFVSNRVDHSLIGVYTLRTRRVTFLAPSVDHDTSPTWSPDGKRVAFIRRPGTPFGQQAHQGAGGIGNPDGPAYNPLTAQRGGVAGTGRGGGRGRASTGTSQASDRAGLFESAFTGGYTMAFVVADASSGEGHEFWHNQRGDRDFNAISSIRWTGADHVIFEAEPQEWARWYTVEVPASPRGDGAVSEAAVMLTPGDGAVEQTAVSPDGRFLFYATNAGDIERRHVWKVPTAGGAAEPLTKGETIETYPAALASGRVAVLGGDARRPFGVGIVAAAGGAPKYIYPSLAQFPIDAEVVPQLVLTRAADGTEVHNQLFLPKDLKPGEKRPAIVFVHGGPVRQMLLGYHYMHFYHVAYAVNQWLASRGYVVMSINYRSGIGYGKSFRTAPNTGGRGNAEYQDVLAGGKYLQTRQDVDANRVGIWGLSYGGVLTAQALARNSDIFKVGVDMAGVHLWGSSLDPDSVSYQSSVISAIDTWKSPVLLEQGDDDRNVQFSQMTGLVQLLRAHNVYHEVMVFTDDTHEPLLHARYLQVFNRLEEFIGRYLKGSPALSTAGGR